MDNARQQIVDSIKANSNILVTVSTDPSVDELAAALGLTILLNNIDKRATAVASGTIPPAINFLEPDKTFENTADSLRDFIIALDKEKADHLRYKVDGDVVKIFITPYRTTLTQADLDFSQGDYNVELVVAIGVKDQDHLDKALASHGKILHDATVVTVTAGSDTSSLGTIDWHDGAASSLSEMMVSLVDGLKTDKPLLDQQIASAFLTGIVSATERFSNDRTSSRVMTMAAQLMAAGANQQLIAAKLEEAHDIAPAGATKVTPKDDTSSDSGEKDTQTAKSDSNELSIARSERKAKADAATNSDEAQKQQELEAQLAGIVTPPTPVVETLADIEQELQQQTAEQASDEPYDEPSEETTAPEVPALEPEPQPEPVPELPPELNEAPEPAPETFESVPEAPEPAPETPESQSASQDVPVTDSVGVMPDFEPITIPDQQSLPEPAPEAEQVPPLPDSTTEIINEHGSLSTQPPTQTQPINSIQGVANEGEPTIDPFAMPPVQQPADTVEAKATALSEPAASPAPFVPEPPVAVGTPEGAALLGGNPVSAPAVNPQPAPTQLPTLPPLPPLPTDGSFPPLPPPPPLPDFSQPAGTMPSGPVSADQLGDIFGSTPASEPVPAAPAPAPEPGQFRIPGQS